MDFDISECVLLLVMLYGLFCILFIWVRGIMRFFGKKLDENRWAFLESCGYLSLFVLFLFALFGLSECSGPVS